MTRKASPRSELTALLDALEGEILAASQDEVRDALGEVGRGNIICREVRALLNGAITTSEDGSAATLWSDTRAGVRFGVSKEPRAGALSHPHAGAILARSYRRH